MSLFQKPLRPPSIDRSPATTQPYAEQAPCAAPQGYRAAVRYRRDIDGLRALAVVPVILFHAGVAPFTGGYVGVDVFFVISGYLIAGLITAEMERGRFTVVGFYERRIRRIFPALFLVLAASFVAAFFLLLPQTFTEFSKSLVAATLFASNMLFDRSTGYFASPAEREVLLHTWSLAIEEQFYLLFPLLLLTARRFAGGRFLPVLLPILALSLAFGVASELLRPHQSFYLLPARGWELLLGAVLAHEVVRAPSGARLRDLLSLAALVMLGVSIFVFDQSTPYPGWHALLPCLGTALLIWCGKGGEAGFVQRLLAWRPLVFVGLISYSLYLWHWPLLAFSRARKLGALEPLETAAVLAVVVTLSVLSWRYVERPFRGAGGVLTRRQVFLCAAAAMAATTALGGFGVVTRGWPARLPDFDADYRIPGRESYNEGRCFLRNEQTYNDWQGATCFLARGKSRTLLLWGDSLAAHYAPGLTAHGEALDYDVLQYTKSGCRPFLEPVTGRPSDCSAVNSHAERIIEDYGVDAVLLAGRWAADADRLDLLESTVRQLKMRGLRVFVIGQTPIFPFENAYDYAYLTGRSYGPLGFDRALNEAVRQAAAGAVFVDPSEALCDAGRCIFRDAGGFLYWEGSHLSVYGSDVLVERLLPQLR